MNIILKLLVWKNEIEKEKNIEILNFELIINFSNIKKYHIYIIK